MTFPSRPNEMANTAAVCSAGGRVRSVPSLLFSIILLTVFAGLRVSSADVHAATGHVRHKRTVSDLFEGLMNAMYFHMDPVPVSSTVIARITKVPPATRVYKYVPVKTLKVSKLRARNLAEPKVKIRYPKKFSIKTNAGSSSLTLVKNDVPWTLHPLPPPLPTSHAVRLEVDKSMPWALHPLPPPMKTKNYSDYYWPGGEGRPKNRPKPVSRPRPEAAVKPSHFVKNVNFNKYFGADKPPPPSVANVGHPDHYHPGHSDFKPSDEYITEHVDHDEQHKPDHHHDDDDELNHVDYKHVNYKQVDYNHVDYIKSPDEYKSTDDYKTEYSRPAGEDHHHDDGGGGGGDGVVGGGGGGGGGGGADDDGYLHSSYSHDDHGHDTSGYLAHGTSPPPPSSEYVSHITIEPSIQIASFSETEMQGDGTANRDALRSERQKCQCTTNGHRHKRDATNDTVAVAAAALQPAKDPNAEQSAARNAYVGRPHVGHATDVQIIRSHDITDQSIISDGSVGYVQHVRNTNAAAAADSLLRPPPVDGSRAETKKAEPTFRDDSDKFKNEFGRQINSWDESKANRGRFTFKSNDDGVGGGAGHYDNDDFGYRATRKPNHEGGGFHVTKSTVENSDRGVAFSVQTPFSVSSFSSNVRHPGERHEFRYANADDSRTTTSPLLSSFPSGYPDEPLEFEQFGLQSALTDDGSRGRSHFSRGPGRLTSHFPRDFDNDRGREKPFRHHAGSSDRFNGGRFKGGRPSSEGSVLEYFQPVVLDFEKSKGDSNSNFFAGNSGGGGGSGEKSRFFGKSDSASAGGFSKLKKNQNLDSLRLPGRLHESNENLSRKMRFHPSTFDID